MFDFCTLLLWLIPLDEKGATPLLALDKAVKFLWVSRLILAYKVIDMYRVGFSEVGFFLTFFLQLLVLDPI